VKAEDGLRLGSGAVQGLEAEFEGSNQWTDGGVGFASFAAARTIFRAATSTFADKLVRFGTVRPAGTGFDPVPRAKFQYLCTLMAQAATEVHAEIKAGPTAVDRSWRLLFKRRAGGGCHAARC
jgi:hypothetical protein